MKTNSKITTLVLLFLLACVSSCSVIGGIFKAGVWVGILMVVGIVGLIIFLISRSGGK